MRLKQIAIILFCFVLTLLTVSGAAQPVKIINDKINHTVTINNKKLQLVLDYNKKISVVSMTVNGQPVIDAADGIYSTARSAQATISSLQLLTVPVIAIQNQSVTVSSIHYGDKDFSETENWTFVVKPDAVRWDIERSFSAPVEVQEDAAPVFNFAGINTWEGAYQGYGGLAWFYLFNEKRCTYGVHTTSSAFWNSKTNNGLLLQVDAPGKQVAMKYSRTDDDRLLYGITVSDNAMLPRFDSGTHRRRFIRNSLDVWAPYTVSGGKKYQSITLSYFNFTEKYGRGNFKGIDGDQVSGVMNTIARIGVIDSLHFGCNSWHTPYGPICLHEQYVAQMGLGINDPAYLKGYQSCLDYYRNHAIKPDGRVYARWAYTDEDMMAGQGNKEGFYEAQWGILMDANPDLVTNVAELYDLTGDTKWVRTHQQSCEKVLEWIMHRDSDGNGLVEMMPTSHTQQVSSDWIDIIWASYENAFVNAKLYHALIKWATVERQLHNVAKAGAYETFAARLKTSFNKPVREGGFWDEANNCYVYWLDKDKSVHGSNIVTPVNFMAIAYGICDNPARQKIILDGIEAGMQRESLFFWPLAMTSYAPGEGRASQYPFPAYENGDIFLSWGSIAVRAYAMYDAAIAVKYVKNVLNQYSKDGLAFQRYGRLKQDGLGDDILSGNALAITGLYQAVYGINPLYNRFYLDPHIIPALAGTALNYQFRNDHLTIRLDTARYSISDKLYSLSCSTNFGFYAGNHTLSFFNGNSADANLQVTGGTSLSVAILNWKADTMAWEQRVPASPLQSLIYSVRLITPHTDYLFFVDGKMIKKINSDASGSIIINRRPAVALEKLLLVKAKS